MRLCDLPDEQLDVIIKLPEDQKMAYTGDLIMKYYTSVIYGSEEFSNLQKSYIASFEAEKLYRTNEAFQAGFKAVYTKTLLMRNIVNDIFFTEDDLVIH